MTDLEARLAAALKARSASVVPDPNAWERHRAAAMTQPLPSSRHWLSRGRVLPLVVAAAVVLVAAIGTSIVVLDNGSAPASAPTSATGEPATPATATSRTTAVRRSGIPAPAAVTTTVAVPALTCAGTVLGSAHLTPVGVNGFAVRLQLRRAAGEELLCAGITGTASGTVQISTGGTVHGGGPLDLAASSTWDQGSPVVVWGAVETRVSGVHVTGTGGKAAHVQFAALASGRRAFIAVLPANTKTATLAATAADGRTIGTRSLTTTFGEPDALPTAVSAPLTSAPSTSAPASSHPSTTSSRTTVIAPTSPEPITSGTSTALPPPGPASGCDGPGTGISIVDLGMGSGAVSFNYLPSTTTLCFSNGGPLRAAHRVAGVMPYAARTTLVSGQGVWGAVTSKVEEVVLVDDSSPKGRPAQLLPLGDDLRVFVEETAGPVRLKALSATGAQLYTLTLN